MIISPFAAGTGHVVGGTVNNLFRGKDLGEAFGDSFDGIGNSIAIGEVIGATSTIATCYATGISPWTGKINRPLYHYTTSEAAERIEQTQLGFDENSWVYLTPDGQKTPIQAQIDLALPQNNTGKALLEIHTNTLYPKDFIIQRRVTGNVFNRGGGGYEMIYKGTIPSNNFRRIR